MNLSEIRMVVNDRLPPDGMLIGYSTLETIWTPEGRVIFRLGFDGIAVKNIGRKKED